MWPNVGTKSVPYSPKITQKVATNVLVKKLKLNIWATFARNFVSQIYYKNRNMVTLVPEGKINFIFDKIVVDQVWPFELIKRPSLDLNKIK